MEHVSKFAKLSFPNNFLISCRIYNKEGVTKILKIFDTPSLLGKML